MEVIGILLWAVTGFLSYGVHKGLWRKFEADYYARGLSGSYSRALEIYVLGMALSGPIGLIAMILVSLGRNKRLDWCLRMPEELKASK